MESSDEAPFTLPERWGWQGCYDIPELKATKFEFPDNSHNPAFAVAQRLLRSCKRAPGHTEGCPFTEEIAQMRLCFAAQRERQLVEAALRTANLRPFPLGDQGSELAFTIDSAAAEAYFLYTKASGNYYARSRSSSCASLSLLLRKILEKQDIKTQPMHYVAPDKSFFHMYLQYTTDKGEIFPIDPTWRQFRPVTFHPPDEPDVFIAPPGQLVPALNAHGVAPEHHHVWLEAEEYNGPWQEHASLALEEIFAERNWD